MPVWEDLKNSAIIANRNLVREAYKKDSLSKSSGLEWSEAAIALDIAKFLVDDNEDISNDVLSKIESIITSIDETSIGTIYQMSLIGLNLPSNGYDSGGGIGTTVLSEVGEDYIKVREEILADQKIYHVRAEIDGKQIKPYVDDKFLTIEDTLTEDITSNGVGSVGGVDENYVFTTGMSFTDIMKKIFQRANDAEYEQSTASISDNIGSTFEVGQSFAATLTISYSQKDSGAPTEARFYVDGALSHTDNSSPFSWTTASLDIDTNGGIVQFTGLIDHEQGAQKFDNFGNPSGDPSVLVPARTGLGMNTITITGRRKIFYGKNNSAPTNSAQVRSLNSSQFVNDKTFTVSVINGDTSVEFAIPATESISSVIFVGSLTNDETSNFTSTETIVSVEGAEGKYPINYKVYRYVPSVPFSSSADYNIRLS